MTQKAITDIITPLSTRIQSFEDTKSEIAGSGLGTALGLANASTWDTIISQLKSVVNRGTISGTISTSGGSYTVPKGYHNGSGKVTGPVLNDLIGSNVTLDSASKLLSGTTAYGKNGTKYTGTMTNNGAVSKTMTSNGTYTIPAGYHNGSGTVTVDVQDKIILCESVYYYRSGSSYNAAIIKTDGTGAYTNNGNTTLTGDIVTVALQKITAIKDCVVVENGAETELSAGEVMSVASSTVKRGFQVYQK
ncbi:MAG: hypothetical protein NC131_18735 [Roseburia sp.]|nr:hypothetical protein [Roseburia sp.]